MKKKSVPALHSLSNHHSFRLVNKIYFDVIVIVDDIARRGNDHSACR